MKIEVTLDQLDIESCFNKTINKYLSGTSRLVIKNKKGSYRGIQLSMLQYDENSDSWKEIGHMDIDGEDLTKAIKNAMND